MTRPPLPTSPGIYTKLVGVDKVDLLLGPYGTNQIGGHPGAGSQEPHDHRDPGHRLQPRGSLQEFLLDDPLRRGPRARVRRAASSKSQRRRIPSRGTVAIVGADAEFGKNSTDGARANAQAAGLTIVYDQRYPPATTDLTPVVRAIKATDPDVVFAAAYPPDTVGLLFAPPPRSAWRPR